REQHRNERPHQQQNRRKPHRPPTKPIPTHRSSSSLRHSRRTYADPTHTFAAVSLHPPTMTTRKNRIHRNRSGSVQPRPATVGRDVLGGSLPTHENAYARTGPIS